MQPDILVMDEPASHLDPKSRRALINLLRHFHHTKIIASHDLDLILDVCRRCIIVKEGRVVADGPTEEILSDRQLLEENNLELPLSLQKRDLPSGGTMDEISKLHHLLGHWAEHNIEHAKTYEDWSKKADALGKKELAGAFEERSLTRPWQWTAALNRPWSSAGRHMAVMSQEDIMGRKILRAVLIKYNVRCNSSNNVEARDWEAFERTTVMALSALFLLRTMTK